MTFFDLKQSLRIQTHTNKFKRIQSYKNKSDTRIGMANLVNTYLGVKLYPKQHELLTLDKYQLNSQNQT